MTGLKMTTMTVKEMRAARERGESKTDLEFLHRNQLAGIEPRLCQNTSHSKSRKNIT